MTTPAKRAEAALRPFLDYILSEASEHRTDLSRLYDQVALAERRIADALGKAVRLRQSQRAPARPTKVTWTGTEGEARKAELVRRHASGQSVPEIMQAMGLAKSQVATAISKFARPRPQAGAGSGAGRTAHHSPVAHAAPLPEGS